MLEITALSPGMRYRIASASSAVISTHLSLSHSKLLRAGPVLLCCARRVGGRLEIHDPFSRNLLAYYVDGHPELKKCSHLFAFDIDATSIDISSSSTRLGHQTRSSQRVESHLLEITGVVNSIRAHFSELFQSFMAHKLGSGFLGGSGFMWSERAAPWPLPLETSLTCILTSARDEIRFPSLWPSDSNQAKCTAPCFRK